MRLVLEQRLPVPAMAWLGHRRRRGARLQWELGFTAGVVGTGAGAVVGAAEVSAGGLRGDHCDQRRLAPAARDQSCRLRVRRCVDGRHGLFTLGRESLQPFFQTLGLADFLQHRLVSGS